MKQSERYLLQDLKSPYFKKHSISLEIKRIYTDIDGIVLAKATVPAAIQVAFPFFLLGGFDRTGGYRIGFKVLPVPDSVKYIKSFVNNANGNPQDIIGFSGLDQITNLLMVGDIVHVFTDSILAPTYFIWIVQQCKSAAIASIVQNAETTQKDDRINSMYVENISYLCDNIDQLNEPFEFVEMDNIGQYKSDNIVLNIVKYPYTKQADLVILPVRFRITQYFGIYSKIRFATDVIQLDLNLKKIE